MNCEQAAEFVSALCDGERIPRMAAEHVGACESCGTRLKEYVEMGAELRRIASLESTEPNPRTWEKQQREKSNWWQKGWGTMRIPKLAFALLLIAVLVLSSGLVIMKVRAQTQGPVLMLTAAPATGDPLRCALSMVDKNLDFCALLQPDEQIYAFRVISNNGDRIELGVRALFISSTAAPGTHSASLEDVYKIPEKRYWFEPGESLKIDVSGTGPMIVTGQLMDHMPSIVTGPADNELDPAPGELRVFSPVLVSDKKVIVDFEGLLTTASTKNFGVSLYAPSEGRYILSLSPLEGAVQGHVSTSRVSFEMDGKSYAFLMAAPVARSETVWVLHQPNYRPSQESPMNQDDQIMGGDFNVNSLLAKPSQQN